MTYGLALSGGGARGAAHVGVLKALEEEGILPTSLAGTSAGSIVAGLYGAGISIKEMEELVIYLSKHGKSYIDPDWIGLLGMAAQKAAGSKITISGLIKGNKFLRLLCDIVGQISITSVSHKLVIPAVDLISGNTIAFTNSSQTKKKEHVEWVRDGRLCEIMMASSSVPAIFQPRVIDGYCLVDGGVGNNLPVDLLIGAGEKTVIGVDIGATYEGLTNPSITEVVTHSFSIMSRDLKDCMSSGEKLLLKPDLKADAGLLDFGDMPESMEVGYQYTKNMMPQIKRVLGMEKNNFL